MFSARGIHALTRVEKITLAALWGTRVESGSPVNRLRRDGVKDAGGLGPGGSTEAVVKWSACLAD